MPPQPRPGISHISTRIIGEESEESEESDTPNTFPTVNPIILYHCVPIRGRGLVPMYKKNLNDWYYYTPSGRETKVTTGKFAQRLRKPQHTISWAGAPIGNINFRRCYGESCPCGGGPFSPAERAEAHMYLASIIL